jgi:hypothetical protein
MNIRIRSSNHFWNLGFTGDVGLTEAAPFRLNTIFGLFVSLNYVAEIFLTFVFVMTFRRDRPGRTTGRTDLACLIEIIKTVAPVMRIDSFGRLEG